MALSDVLSHFINDEYIQEHSRSLPIKEVFITCDWETAPTVKVVISRQHPTGRVTSGIFFIDTYCRGVFLCYYSYNLTPYYYQKAIEGLTAKSNIVECSYELAHSFIYDAIIYALKLGIMPHQGFGLMQCFLDEYTPGYPESGRTFGLHGYPYLIAESQEEADLYIPALEKSVGSEYKVEIREITKKEEEAGAEEEQKLNWDDVMTAFLENLEDKSFEYDDELGYALRKGEYSYVYPHYPTQLTLAHPELEVLYSPEYIDRLSENEITRILSLPRESLIDDLIHILYVEMGNTAGKMSKMLWNPDYISPLTHVIFLLGELRAERALEALLEVLRQSFAFQDFHFGSVSRAKKIIPLTLYQIGRNQLPALRDYGRELDLEPYMRIHLFHAMSYLLWYEKDRSEEVIDWFRGIMRYYHNNADNPRLYDSTLIAMIACVLADVRSIELIPEIKLFYDEKIANLTYSGDMEDLMDQGKDTAWTIKEYALMNIFERYCYLSKNAF